MVALCVGHADLGQPLQHLAALHALGDGLDTHGQPHLVDRIHHAVVDPIAKHVLDELSVDLQEIHRQGLQISERRQTTAEIIQREFSTQPLEFVHEMRDMYEVADGGCLSDLKADGARRRLETLELRHHIVEELRIAQ